MLISVASFLPIIIVGPISDFVGTTIVIFVMAIGVSIVGVISVLTRGPLQASDARPAADPHGDPIAAVLSPEPEPSAVPLAGPVPPVSEPVDPDRATQRTGPSDPTDRD